MEKLRLEVSNRSASVNITPCICTVCGLVLSTQLPLFAAETTPKTPAPKSAAIAAKVSTKTDEIGEQALRPMAFRRTTTAPSPAKSQVSKAQSTPLQTLKATTASKATRFALTTPSSARVNNDGARAMQIEDVQPDERIVMTALPTDNAGASTPDARANLAKTATTNRPATKVDILDTIALAQKIALQQNEGGEPLTGTVEVAEKSHKVDTPKSAEKSPVPIEIAPSSNASTAKVLEATIEIPATPSEAKTTEIKTVESTTVVTADSKIAQTSRLYAPSIAYDGGTIIAEGTAEDPVRLEGTGTRIIARKVRLDTVKKQVSAEGAVRVERQVSSKRFSTYGGKAAGGSAETEMVTETLQGENFEYNYETREGTLGATRVRLANFNISAEKIIINGTKYIAHNVVIRPGGLSDQEIRIYGTPPFSIRARTAEVDTSKPAPPNKISSDTADDVQTGGPVTARTRVSGAGLYFKNFRILPIPSALLGRTLGGPREQETYQLTPRIAFNSTDGVLATVGLKYPFSPMNPDRLTLTTDIGLSTKVGFRGGFSFDTNNNLGRFAIGARVNDVISSQLTNRIELDRLPELTYEAPKIALFDLPGGRRAGFRFDLSAGDYRERFTTGNRIVAGSRFQGQVRFTTRMGKRTGPYLDLTARAARYSVDSSNLNTMGFEVGYAGTLGSRLTGQFSYGATKVNGSTPFRFDRVAIRQELRATFDILLTPRYIIPIDLRYDLDRKQLRERKFGLLRNYKTFAYGVTYQASRQELQFEVRQGF